MANCELTIAGLTTLDEEELREILPEGQVDTNRTSVPEGTLAEPATVTAVVTLGSMAIAGLGAWLSKPRRRRLSRFRYNLRKPNGEAVEIELDIDESSEEAAKASIIQQLGRFIPASENTPDDK